MAITYNYKAAFFTITTKTPMHCGAGGENSWIIDKLIQRDEMTNLPCVNSSSLKGAFREYMKDYLSSKKAQPNEENSPVSETQESTSAKPLRKPIKEQCWASILFQIFGNDKSDINKEDQEGILKQIAVDLGKDPKKWKEIDMAGDFRFLPAELLSIPTLQEGHIKYIVSCEWLKNNLLEKISLFEKELFPSTYINSIFSDTNFLNPNIFCEKVDDYNLPVIARNHLEDGTSTNLWYEQVLPRETKLFFAVVYSNEELFEIFRDSITAYPVQIGANASVGYGFCKIELIPTTFKNAII